ncbi:MAG: Cell envelope-related transcriptional attenuator [Parcubacteria group bacterium Gr01-1014_13]|nr:MAG: Cell envelope-related transcriptional attenuator [Parcubacteria group bacterium Gr01-1014_13]
MDEQSINLLKPQNYPLSDPPKKKTKRVIFLALALTILGLLIFRNYTMTKWPNNPDDYDSVTLKPKRIGFLQTVKNFIFSSDNVIAGDQDGRINILLLGIGGSGHDGPYLSDTNIILSIKPSTNEVAMISIPRDLAVRINNHGVRKINNADAFGEAEQANGGGEYARKVFEKTFGISIPYYARVDFMAFKELVDAVGGIEVNVQRSFVDTAYPGPNHSFQTISFQAGPQQLNGERALMFARSRHGSNGEGSDFARAKRQQLVLTAFKKEVLSAGTFLNPVTLQKIFSSLSQHIVTNLDFGQTMYLISLAKQLNSDELKTLVIDDSPNGFLKSIIGEDGAYLLIPKSGNFSEITSAINNIFEATSTMAAYTPNQNQPITIASVIPSIPSVKIEIQNGTWQPGLAAFKKQELEKEGLQIFSIGNSAKRPIATTTIYLINPNVSSTIVTSLKGKFHALTSNTLPEWLQRAYNAASSSRDILIVLGQDMVE